jgi:hypothetical protein
MTRFTLAFRDIFDDLVERKLWPVALVLVVALVAVPVVLSKPAGRQAPAASAGAVPAAGTGSSPGSSPLGQFQPVVSAVDSGTVVDRKDLKAFASKNPFAAKGLDLAAAATAGDAQPLVGSGDATATAGGSGDATAETAPTTTEGGSGSGGGDTVYYQYTAKVRFGEEGDTKTLTLNQLRSLPSSDNAVTIFMGVRSDGKTATFLVSSAATTTGDGDCHPSDTTCTFLYMKKGDRQLIETVTPDGAVVDYELELVDIGVKKTKSPEKATSSKAHGSKAHASRAARRSAARRERRLARAREKRLARAFSRLSF